jgi:hypothetical protein
VCISIDKYNPILIDILSKHYLCNTQEAIQYSDILFRTDDGKNIITGILEMHGKIDEINKLMKITHT